VAEELAQEQRLHQRRAVDLDQRASRAIAGGVDRVGDQLLAGTAFALDEQRRLSFTDAPHRIEQRYDTRMAAREAHLGTASERRHIGAQRRLLDRVFLDRSGIESFGGEALEAAQTHHVAARQVRVARFSWQRSGDLVAQRRGDAHVLCEGRSVVVGQGDLGRQDVRLAGKLLVPAFPGGDYGAKRRIPGRPSRSACNQAL
jgi:hypothetical protein